MKNAIGIDGNHQLCRREPKRVAHGARFSAVDGIPAHSDLYIGKVALRLKHPLVAVIHRAIVLPNHFKLVVGVIALADALDRLVDRFALVETGHEDTHRRLVRVVFLDRRPRNRPFQDKRQRVLEDRDQQA
jgi:hypothetical protein